MTYVPSTHRALTFHDHRAGFTGGDDSPRDYLERCLQVIADKEGLLKGWVVMNPEGARAAADASTQRYRQGRPLSAIDGMPVGIKDLIETRDMPTQMGCAAFEGNFPKNDSAVVRALRDAGAIILGKTVTTALGFLDPGPTTNAFDPLRTPGGSSSGSAAVVGANMVPLAIGSQLVGSILRPASFNANWALKPTFGALNRGERLGLSQAHLGIHANCVEDMWTAAAEIALRAGGDPGHPGLQGPRQPPAAIRPRRLVALETEGWARAEPGARDAFEACLKTLSEQGVRILRRSDSALIEALEQSISQAAGLSLRLISWEQRWSLANLVENHPDTLGPSLLRQLESGRSMTLAEYRECLLLREHARQRLAALATQCDALVSLNACGPAPLAADIRDSKYPTGDVSFACASSLLGAPAINVPAMAVDGLPLGLQVLGMAQADAAITGIATWLSQALHRSA
ncbi:amidase [Bordetella trematum]|uniref:amidase n=1 Tax=Bordetella trematum TaxID=123899 RepID=UPI000D8F4091|nr:amidase [Bordetella trematum]SPU51591.1 amidase [Bordetella trematum]VDH08482.1 Glutamyl-tRNA(Gln) amidotransferase subunit A [Bordetella trematum]